MRETVSSIVRVVVKHGHVLQEHVKVGVRLSLMNVDLALMHVKEPVPMPVKETVPQDVKVLVKQDVKEIVKLIVKEPVRMHVKVSVNPIVSAIVRKHVNTDVNLIHVNTYAS